MSFRSTTAAGDYLHRLSRPVPAVKVPLTMACWFRRDNTSGAQHAFHLGTNADSMRLHVSNNQAHCTHRTSSTNSTATASGTFSAGTWNHLVGRFVSNSDRRAILNAGTEGSNTAARADVNFDRVHIGRPQDPGLQQWVGEIAHCAAWDEVLGDGEVERLFRGANPLSIRPRRLLMYWPLTFDGRNALNPNLGVFPAGAVVPVWRDDPPVEPPPRRYIYLVQPQEAGDGLTASLAATGDDATLAASASVGTEAAVSVTAADAGLAASATTTVGATLAAAAADDGVAATAAVAVSATLAASAADAALAASTAVTLTATLAVTAGDDTLAAVASQAEGLTASLAVTADDATLVSAASVTIGAALAATEAADTISGSAAVAVAATAAPTEAADTIAALGGVRIVGSLVVAEGSDAIVAAGAVPADLWLTATEAGDVATATATVQTPGEIDMTTIDLRRAVRFAAPAAVRFAAPAAVRMTR